MTDGGESMQPSPRPAILFLKFPATMLQISPNASEMSGPTLSISTPSIFDAMRAAASCWQRTLITPQSIPARPTIAVTFRRADGSVVDEVNWDASMVSNTSRVASSSTGRQSLWMSSAAGIRFLVFTIASQNRGLVRSQAGSITSPVNGTSARKRRGFSARQRLNDAQRASGQRLLIISKQIFRRIRPVAADYQFTRNLEVFRSRSFVPERILHSLGGRPHWADWSKWFRKIYAPSDSCRRRKPRQRRNCRAQTSSAQLR